MISDASTAATYQILTNAGGIVTIKMDLPVKPGKFNVIVSAVDKEIVIR